MLKRLAILVVALLASGSNGPRASSPETPSPESGEAGSQLPPDPFGPNPRHPPEVTRLLNLFPAIPADGTLDDTLAFLGLSRNNIDQGWAGEDVYVGCPIAPGYRLELYFERDKPGYRFSGAVISVRGMPGRPANQYNRVYPLRSGNRMVTDE